MDAGRLQPLSPLWRYRPPPPTAMALPSEPSPGQRGQLTYKGHWSETW